MACQCWTLRDPFIECIVFHDVDLVPRSDGVPYNKCEVPIQLGSELSHFNNGVPYKECAGGVVSMNIRDWKKINGFSNDCEGWGGEDDDLFHRLKANKLLDNMTHTITRPPKGNGVFEALTQSPQHHKQKKGSTEYSHSLKTLCPRNTQYQMNVSSIIQTREKAEQLWRSQRGYLWMQHSRKAGGTSLCMHLRLNQAGLIRTNPTQWQSQRRKTCQIASLCWDCNIKKLQNRYRKPTDLPPMVMGAMDKEGVNFIEVEGTSAPDDLLVNRAWDRFVFISSLRHPIDRIVSSVMNDPIKSLGMSNTQCDGNDWECRRSCIDSDTKILKFCDRGIFLCYSNYYIRQFSGLEHGNTEDMMALAKANFKRFSCVALQEQFEGTLGCLGEKLGLYLRNDGSFNIAGQLGKKDNRNNDISYDQLLSSEERERLYRLNAADLEFFEWAREQVLTSKGAWRKA